jgi:hypothetical protein
MSDTSIERFVLGYGSDGYEVLAQSPGLSTALQRVCLNEASRWELAGSGTAWVVTPLWSRERFAGFLAFTAREVDAAGQSRGHLEKAFAIAQGTMATATIDIVAALPRFDARGELSAFPRRGEAAPIQGEPDASLGRVWAAVILGRAVTLAGLTKGYEELAFCLRVFALLPPESSATAAIGLGIAADPPGSPRAGVFRRANDTSVKGAIRIEAGSGAAESAPERDIDALATWFERYIPPPVRDDPDHLNALWTAMRASARIETLEPAVFLACALADLVADAASSSTGIDVEARRWIEDGKPHAAFRWRLEGRAASFESPSAGRAIEKLAEALGDEPVSPSDRDATLLRALAALRLQSILVARVNAMEERASDLPRVDLAALRSDCRRHFEIGYWSLVAEFLGRLARVAPEAFGEALDSLCALPRELRPDGLVHRLLWAARRSEQPQQLRQHLGRLRGTSSTSAPQPTKIGHAAWLSRALDGEVDRELLMRIASAVGDGDLRSLLESTVFAAYALPPGNEIEERLGPVALLAAYRQ